ncbi:MAG: 2-oxoacid:acceptor oxidoreductase family protein [Peptostreptococcaceae bacterium]|nr:2-oxoacid:acceptor oxidoreductase family protein [Peptostreptococcaceae bacterium]
MKREIRLCGAGGQGLILAGIIIAEASIREGLNSLQSQSYGPEARGGASKAEVIVSDEEIFFPKVRKPNLLLALSQKAFDKYADELHEDAVVVIDEELAINHSDNGHRIYRLPILSTASDKIGKAMVANIVALGALSKLIPEIDRKNMLAAVLARVPRGTEELNTTAFEEGEKLVAASSQHMTGLS